ncbi:MAG: YbhB/YbcL family Raf kinase inhibitor-like protein [Alphaproteobacteria bacterium]|nr:YbhB/YbcL family Raf kinase inhibitor-like protein [Alphaproteobacteria bacterium]MBN9570277.1 YbhB/YbcL family Raf kinase inhibitor-like protein [Alphaproteobacteria bacterium]
MKAIFAALALTALCAAPVFAQSVRPIALQEFPPKNGARLTVTSPAFPEGGDIPFENTQYRGNSFPGLAWSAGPAGTKSYAIIMQDPDAQRNGQPILHWTMYNLPAGVTKLDPGMAPTGNPQGSSYGPNVRGEAQPYMGPRTPPGPKHHYHLQVFALDTTLTADPSMNYDGLTGAMRDHILASGETVGLAQADPNAPPPAPRP